MPCENCRVEFTVFRRKRSCFDCRRYYCNNCLTVTKHCPRCAIFARRPLLRADLIKLKPKDLIFYLQSKHISTDGCLEKEELVGLVLAHVAQVDNGGVPSSTPSSPGRNQSNPIDNIKQTCQNFFTNLSDNLSESFASFDTKPSARSAESNTSTSHIVEQPRVSTRQIPTYASSVNAPTSQLPPQQPQQQHQRSTTSNVDQLQMRVNNANNNSRRPSTSSGVASTSTSTSAGAAQERTTKLPCATIGQQKQETSPTEEGSGGHDKSDCECSDDEIITTFSERLSFKTENSGQASRISAGLGPSTTTTTSTSPGYSKQGSISSKADVCGADVSSQSSFEELGAIGGVSDESKAATDTNSSNPEQWQILEINKNDQTTNVAVDINTPTTSAAEEILEVTVRNNTPSGGQPVSIQTLNIEQHSMPAGPTAVAPCPTQRIKKVTRRRSDGYLNRRHHSSDDEESPEAVTLDTLRELPEVATQSFRGSCQRCGKNKTNIRRRVERMRRHLESSQMSEEDIKRELQEFLSYLEQRTKSIDGSETGSNAVSPLSGVTVSALGANGSATGMPITPTIEFSPTQDDTPWDDDEGIHVYAAPPDFESAPCIDSRFINLNDFEEIKDLDILTVKQLKEVLMLHRVDYKGCCEKQELLDRVVRVWKTLRSAPDVEKLAKDELCKICMDAPIECVFLECGHMGTCTNCGKKCAECPICRQYITRVVRFFKA